MGKKLNVQTKRTKSNEGSKAIKVNTYNEPKS